MFPEIYVANDDTREELVANALEDCPSDLIAQIGEDDSYLIVDIRMVSRNYDGSFHYVDLVGEVLAPEFVAAAVLGSVEGILNVCDVEDGCDCDEADAG